MGTNQMVGITGAIEEAMNYPKFRYMGSKHKLLPWIFDSLKDISFISVLDGFSGSGAVSYLLKSMGKEVSSNDFLHFSYCISKATIENDSEKLSEEDLNFLLHKNSRRKHFILNTFQDIFYTKQDLDFLDSIVFNIQQIQNEHKRYVALASLIRACVKKQPRGVFTVSGDLSNYNDGRRDLRLSIEQHFSEQVRLFNNLIFDNFRPNKTINEDIFNIKEPEQYDLVYLDPPYVPRSDDNCYIKRYHFLEGLSKYWEGEEILYDTKVRKIKKKYTPFSYRKKALNAFEQMFGKFRNSIIVLSYSSNGFPDLDILIDLLKKFKKDVVMLKKDHKYHFGNHKTAKRSKTEEYLIIGK